jgi:hypothetical protein
MAKKNKAFAVKLIDSDTESDETLVIGARQTDPEDSVTELSSLNPEEASQLQELESIVEKGLTTFREVGAALLLIQDKKLYRSTHKNIKSYMADRFGIKKNRGYQLMTAAKTVLELEADLTAQSLPIQAVEPRQDDDQGAEPVITAIPVGKSKKNVVKAIPVEHHDVVYTEVTTKKLDESSPEITSDSHTNVASDDQKEESTATESNPGIHLEDGAAIPLTMLPQTESHASALAELPRENRVEVWSTVVEEAKETGKSITAEKIRKKAADAGVPLNKKAPKDRTPPKNAFGKGIKDEDEFSDAQTEITRSAMRDPGSETKPMDWLKSDKPKLIGQQELRAALRNSLDDEVIIIIKGNLLIREGIADQWATLRGLQEPVDEDFIDQLSYAEAVDLQLF